MEQPDCESDVMQALRVVAGGHDFDRDLDDFGERFVATCRACGYQEDLGPRDHR